MGTPSSRIVRLPQSEPQFLLPHHQKLIEDSRISPEVAAARGYRSVIDPTELESVGFAKYQALTPALLIPIRDITGAVRTYYLRPDHPRADARKKDKVRKYETPAGSKHVLDIPPGQIEQLADPLVDLWITEGSRKVDALVSHGATAIGVMGTWAWNPKERADSQISWDGIELHGRLVHVVYDSDIMTKENVRLSLEALTKRLRSKGARVQIVQLPHLEDESKCGVDDFLAQDHTLQELEKLSQSMTVAPEPIPISSRLSKEQVQELLDGRMRRSERHSLAEQIVRDLDLRGKRYRDRFDQATYYYHDRESSRLIALDWSEGSNTFRVGEFATRLYDWYGINSNDSQLLADVQSAYSTNCPETSPLRYFHCKDDVLYVQASDQEVYRVDAASIELVPNGTDDILFRDGVEESMHVRSELLYKQPRRVWRRVIDQLSLERPTVLTDHQLRTFLEVYFHLAPWFWDWKGLELPLLACVGEGGSGKSHFWYVVQGVQHGLEAGIASVHTPPRDIQELRVFLKASTGMLVFDNFRRGIVRQWLDQWETQLSLAITHKWISYRPLHTDREDRFPTPAIPAITSTQMPVVGSDLVQRTFRVNFKKIDFRSKAEGQMEEGTQLLWPSYILTVDPGREAIFADMLNAAAQFFMLARQKADVYNRQRVRLSGLDRALMLMAEAIGGDELRNEMTEIIEKLPRVISQTQVGADAALNTLRRFAIHWREQVLTKKARKNEFRLKDVVAFVETLSHMHEGKVEYPFQSPRMLSEYIDQQPELIREQTGIWAHRRNQAVPFFTVDIEQLEAVLAEMEAGE